MKVLGIESSCDETGVALVEAPQDPSAPPRLLAEALHTQAAMHADYGGVVPMAEARDDATASPDESTSVPQGDPRRVQVYWDPMLATGAELSLAQYWQPDGTLLILPAYRVTTADDRGTWAIIAVAQTAVEFVAPTE